MPEKNETEALWDEKFMKNLPPAAQRRLIDLGQDLLELEVCREYGFEPGTLLPKVSDAIKKNVDPDVFKEELERAALSIQPLPSDPRALWRLHQEQIEQEGTDGKAE